MEIITIILTGISALFFMLLALKNLFNIKKVCIICASVSLTWIVLLTFYLLKIFTDKTIIAILMGQTSLALFYIWEKKVKNKVRLFRLPLLLSMIFVIYSILESFNLNSLIFLTALWLFFLIVYLLKNNKLAKKIVECCRKW
ncbi:MAG: hypothetical protein AABX91_01530 [Nanoarchaeota archaeon]